MRTDNSLAVGSPTARVAVILATTLLLAVALVTAGVAGQRLLASDGEIVVALVRDEATVKRLKLGRGRVELHPENPAFEPIVIAPDTEIRILGRVVEVRRQMA